METTSFRSGFLMKRGHFKKNWKLRYFVLQADKLIYYVNKDDTSAKGVIDLFHCSQDIPRADEELKRDKFPFGISLSFKGTKYYLCAETETDITEWQSQILRNIRRCHRVASTSISGPVVLNGRLHVSIIAAHGLAAKDVNGFSDPFCVVVLNKQQHKTATLYKTLDPQWEGEDFDFEVTSRVDHLVVLCWDEDSFKANDFLGTVSVTLADVADAENATLSGRFKLLPRKAGEKVKGEIEMKLWYEAAAGGGMAGSIGATLFSRPLSELCQSEGALVPSLVQECCDYIRAHGLEEDGLFRISGDVEAMHALKTHCDKTWRSPQWLLSDEKLVKNVHVVSSVLKLYLRELPKPLLTYEFYPKYIEIGRKSGKTDCVSKLAALTQQLPPANLATLTTLLHMLHAVAGHSATNRMTPANLGIVFGPNLLRSETETMETLIGDMPIANEVAKLLIEHAPVICPIENWPIIDWYYLDPAGLSQGPVSYKELRQVLSRKAEFIPPAELAYVWCSSWNCEWKLYETLQWDSPALEPSVLRQRSTISYLC